MLMADNGCGVGGRKKGGLLFVVLAGDIKLASPRRPAGRALIGLLGPPDERISSTETPLIGWIVDRRGDAVEDLGVSEGGGKEPSSEDSMVIMKPSSSESIESSS
jgi:hypothetical protein